MVYILHYYTEQKVNRGKYIDFKFFLVTNLLAKHKKSVKSAIIWGKIDKNWRNSIDGRIKAFKQKENGEK